MKDIRGEYVKMGVEFPIFMLVLTDNEYCKNCKATLTFAFYQPCVIWKERQSLPELDHASYNSIMSWGSVQKRRNGTYHVLSHYAPSYPVPNFGRSGLLHCSQIFS